MLHSQYLHEIQNWRYLKSSLVFNICDFIIKLADILINGRNIYMNGITYAKVKKRVLFYKTWIAFNLPCIFP